MSKKTLKEIATSLDVSASMVSLVLHNRAGVGKENRARITQALSANGYKIFPNCQNGEVCNICFLKFSSHTMLVNGNPGFVNAITDSIEKEVRSRGYSLVMTIMDEKNSSSVLETLEESAPSGVILLGTELDSRHKQIVESIRLPFVIVDNPMEFEKCACVTMNNLDAIYEAVRYLVQLGHPNIGFLANAIPSGNCSSRRCAFERSMYLLGQTFRPELVYEISPTMEGSYQSILGLLRNGCKFPAALIANNDCIALGAIKAFREFGVRIPEDLSIIGFDDIGYSSIADPPLTTMRVSCSTIGTYTVDLLCDRIAHPARPFAKIQVSPELIVRQSTCRYTPDSSGPCHTINN